MITRLLACVFLGLALRPSLRAETVPYPPINPALLYWSAAAQLVKPSDAQALELKRMALGEIPPDDTKIRQFFLGNADDLLRKAALSPVACDWGLPKEDGPGVSLSYLAKMQELTQIAVAEAEVSFARPDLAGGQEWLLTAHRMARHAGAGGFLVSFIVQTGLNELATRAAGRHCLAWDGPTRQHYAEQREALPPLHTLQETYRVDSEVMTDWIERLSQMDGPQRQQALEAAFIDQKSGGPGPGDDPVHWDQTTWHRKLDEWRTLQRESVDALGEPWKASHIKLAALAETSQGKGFSFYKEAYPAVGANLQRSAAAATLDAMLDAALRYGAAITEADAATCHDAFEGEPLHLRKTDAGSESLVASAQYPKGKNIELKLGN